MSKNLFFYKELKKEKIPLVELLGNESLFHAVPEDWHLILIDVENSTQAIQEGKHQDINLSATGAIVAVLNTIKKLHPNVRVPYFFGGDGVTFISPPELVDELIKVLATYRLHILKTSGLHFKLGSIKLEEVYKTNLTLRIAKLKLTPQLTIPIVIGNGFKHAENKIKEDFTKNDVSQIPKEILDLTGMQCRWKEIEAPTDESKIFCLLVQVKQEENQGVLFKAIIQKMNKIFGDYANRQPISIPKLILDLDPKKIKNELQFRLGRVQSIQFLKDWLITIFGKFYFKFFKKGKKYVQRVKQLSHTIMIDGALNTICSGTQADINTFLKYLNELEGFGDIVYGIHITDSSIMSCYVQDYGLKHNHFVDGSEGGYTKAAVMLKSKLKGS